MPHGSLIFLADQILRFALNPAEDPEDDVAASRSLTADILRQVSVEEEGEWDSSLVSLMKPLAQEIIDSPALWSQVIRRVHIYFDSAETTEEHPRRDSRFHAMRGSDQDRVYSVPLNLSLLLARSLLLSAAPRNLLVFLDTLDDWEGLRAVTGVLDTVDLDMKSLAALLHRADAKTRNDLVREQILGPIQRKVAGAPEMGRQIVDAWLAGESWAVSLDLPAISLLVEAAITDDPAATTWRDRVIEVLVDKRTTDHLGLAAYLACFAWPEPRPAVEERHAALMKHVERWPSYLIDFGLNAMVREASQHPRHAIKTAIKLVELLPADGPGAGEVRESRARFLAKICFYAANTLKKRGDGLTVLLQAMPFLVFHPPPASQELDLDAVFSDLVVDHEDDLKRFLMEWILKNKQALVGRSLGEMFNLTVTSIGVETEARWLASFMISADRELRNAASLLLAHREVQTPIPGEYLRRLAAEQVLAIAFQLSGSGAPGSVWVPVLFQIAKERVDVRRELVDFILQHAVPDYPGACAEELKTWEADESPSAGEESLTPDLRYAGTAISEALARDQAVHDKRRELREMTVTTGSRAGWNELFRRGMQQALDEELRSGRYPLAALIPRVPLARGSGCGIKGGYNDVVPLSHLSHSVEGSKRESTDPVAAALSRRSHLVRAEQLLRQYERATE